MRTVSFDFGGRNVHWIDLYNGFGFFASVFLLFSMICAWRLSNLNCTNATASEAGLARTLAWGLFATEIANIVLCLLYFGPVQAGFAAACAATLGWGAARIAPGTASHVPGPSA